jgi:predicted GTPase
VGEVVDHVHAVNPGAGVIRARSPVTLGPGPPLAGRRALVVEDGPTVTHGGMPFGAGTVAARAAGAEIVDPRPWAVGALAETFARYPGLGAVLPAMGYSDAQVADLGATARAVACDLVVTGTPIDLARLVDLGHPVRHATYALDELPDPDEPGLAEWLQPVVERARTGTGAR